ncbi:MAG: hypothetical protein ACFFAS_06560 [Promethearchaeota archaeon]
MEFYPYFLLVFGNIFHLASRTVVFITGVDSNTGLAAHAIVYGAIITGLIMIYFYISIFHLWVILYGKIILRSKE